MQRLSFSHKHLLQVIVCCRMSLCLNLNHQKYVPQLTLNALILQVAQLTETKNDVFDQNVKVLYTLLQFLSDFAIARIIYIGSETG